MRVGALSNNSHAKGGFNRYLLGSAFALSLGCGVSGNALAQGQVAAPSDAAPSDNADANGAGSTSVGDIIVTAQRRTQAISQVPISVQAIGAQTLARSGPVDTTTLITRLSPSVSFRPGVNLGSSSVSIRGVSSIAVEGGIQPSTSVVIDGAPVARQGEFIMDLNDVDSVEVLRGPQGTLFGKNSSAGVISINTHKPTDKFEGSAQVGLTNDEEYFGNAMINVPFTDKVKARLTGFYRDQNPLVKNRGSAADPFGSKNYGFNAKLSFDITETFNLLLSGGYYYIKTTYPIPVVIAPPAAFTIPGLGNLQQIATGITYGYGNDQVNTNTDTVAYGKSKFLQAEMNWEASDEVSLTSITAYRKFDTDYKVDSDVTPFGYDQNVGITPTPASYPIAAGYPFRAEGVRPDRLGAPEALEYASQELRLHYQGERADVVAGVFYQTLSDTASATNPFFFDGTILGIGITVPGTYFVNEARYNYKLNNDAASIFGDVTYKLSDQFSVFGGMRFTHETLNEVYHRDSYFLPVAFWNPATLDPVAGAPKTTTDFSAFKKVNNVSGRAGIQFRPSEGQNYYASFNRGYKGPAAFTGRAAANTALTPAITKPEIATAFEIGTKQRLLDNRLSLGVSVYTQKITDIQQTGNVPGTTFQTLLNAGDLKSKGAEFEMQWQVARGLRLSGGLAYTDATYAGAGAVVACPTNITCLGNGSNVPAGNESIAGRRAISAPKWAYNAAVDYARELGTFGQVSVNVGWSWQDKIQYAVNQDSRTIEPSHGFLNASITLISNQGWEVQVYGRNLTDEFYYGTRSSAFPVGDQFGILNRDYKRYGGASFKYRF